MAWEEEELARCPYCGAQNRLPRERCVSCQNPLGPHYDGSRRAGGHHGVRNTLLVLAALAVLGIWGLVRLAENGTRGAPAAPASIAPLPTRLPQVVYQVRGTGPYGSMTYRNVQGGTGQANHENIPWGISFKARPGQILYLSAQNYQDHGSITCEILVDNQVLQSAESSGGYAIATCSGVVP
jgi:hypothetical protein